MHPDKVVRDRTKKLTDLPNIGTASAADLLLLGISSPAELIGLCPYEMYERLCVKTGVRHDPCVIDVFISITRYVDGEDAKPWWDFTEERKQALKARVR